MRMTHIVASIEREAAGISYSVKRLATAVAALGGSEVSLLSLGAPSRITHEGVLHIRAQQDLSWVPALARLGLSSEMKTTLLNSLDDVLHTHGLWMMPNVYPALAAERLRKSFLLSPRGMLGRDALTFSSTAKRLFWIAWQKRAVEAVTCFHATAESEYEDIRAFGLKQPVAVIPNGIDLPDLAKIKSTETSSSKHTDERPFILSLGRIHPKKGLDRLVSAFALVADENTDWGLRIVGPDERGHAAQLARQISSLKLDGRISIELPVFGDDKLRLMSQAEIFVLPTLHENFGMTVAESLAVETPVISSKGAPWAGLEEHGCGWWVDHGPQAMAAALREAMAMDRDARSAMGVKGRKWMQRDFAWDGIGAKMIDAYRWSLGEIDRPDWVWK